MNLFKNIKIYSIFYISLLKSIDLNIFIEKIFYYTIQKKKRIRNKKNLEITKLIISCQMKKLLIIEKYLKIIQTRKELSKIKRKRKKKKIELINRKYL